MLGQFFARFVANLKPLSLFFAMTILPLLPCVLWFAILFHLNELNFLLSDNLRLSFLLLAIAFVINSLDFMVANYSDTFKISISHIGTAKFVIINSSLLLGLTYLFQEKLMYVQWSAILVIIITYLLLMLSKKHFNKITKTSISDQHHLVK